MNRTYLRGDMYYADLGKRYRLGTRRLPSRRYYPKRCREQTQPYRDYCFYHEQKGRKGKIAYSLSARSGERLGTALSCAFRAATHY